MSSSESQEPFMFTSHYLCHTSSFPTNSSAEFLHYSFQDADHMIVKQTHHPTSAVMSLHTQDHRLHLSPSPPSEESIVHHVSPTPRRNLTVNVPLLEAGSAEQASLLSPQATSRSKSWSFRLSAFFSPSLTHSSIDSKQPSILRKPVGGIPPATLDRAPPPPYVAENPAPPMTTRPRPPLPSQHVASLYDPSSVQPIQPRPESQFNNAPPSIPPPSLPDFSPTSFVQPQPLSSTPLSPESKRLTKQPPPAQAVQPSSQRKSPPSPPDSVPRQNRLFKENKDASSARPRGNSLQQPKAPTIPPLLMSQQPDIQPRQSSPSAELRGRSISAQQPQQTRTADSGTRVASSPVMAPSHSPKEGSQSPSRGRLRRSWLPGNRSRSNSVDPNGKGAGTSYAWVMSDGSNAEYNPSILKNADKVPELWNESGDVLVYLFPRNSGCGPSFKVQHYAVSSSFVFNEYMHASQDSSAHARSRARSFDGRHSLSASDANRFRPSTQSQPLAEPTGSELRLYLPTAPPSASGHLSSPSQTSEVDLERLISYRNLFAFLTGQPLVGTKKQNTVFKVFLQLAGLLKEFGFTNAEGTSYGPAVDLSFGFYMEQLGLADCRHSREKTVEALVLGERMRSTALYNEAFTHAAGKLQAITELDLPIYDLVTPRTRQNLETAKIEMGNRQHITYEQLEQFDFPSLFAGIANSTSSPELKNVRFKIWRTSFNRMRSFILGHYKSAFGSWPPKASSKKNPFAESGLNRLVLKMLYSDMSALYDLMVDRTKRSDRKTDKEPVFHEDAEKMSLEALMMMLSEFERSRPKGPPPIPYDQPLQPSMQSIFPTYNAMSAKDQARAERKLKENELILMMNKAYNFDTSSRKIPFLEEFKEFELREAKGRTAQDLVDQRFGYWLFVYVVIQCLPLLVVDAPGLMFSEGTEYFLCMSPTGSPPWCDEQRRMTWFNVDGGKRVVQLSHDAIIFSVEATYQRSHCWLAAESWDETDGTEPPPIENPALSPLQPPQAVFGDMGPPTLTPPPVVGHTASPPVPLGGPQMAMRPSHNYSPSNESARGSPGWRSSFSLGLEPVPVPVDPYQGGLQGRRSSGEPSLSLNSHLGSRSASAGNLAAMNAPDPRRVSVQPAATSGQTFDDILNTGPKSAKKDEGKKKGRFFS